MSFLGEIKRRRVFQVAAVYAVIGWLLIQIIDVVNEPLNLPEWFDTVAIVLVAIGFVIAVVLAWVFDITPAGVVRTPDAPSPVPTAEVERQRAAAAADTFIDPPATKGSTQKKSAAHPRQSIAVLPLENLSPNPDDAYFAAGIHEEVLNYLTKIRQLSVIARTSVKKYAGTDKSIAEIADELRVGTVMEGSVRYAGDRVRVTAQLIDAATEEHIWSEIYERDLIDVFAIQADIARNIADALHAELSVAEKASIEGLPTTTSAEAQALYLKASALFAQDDSALSVTTPPEVREEIHALLDEAIVIDPAFAHPYGLKALLLASARILDPVSASEWIAFSTERDESARHYAEKALSLNANLGLPHFALAHSHQYNSRISAARESYRRALALKPGDSNILTWYASLEWNAGEYEDATELGERALALDPGNPLTCDILGLIVHGAGRHEASVRLFDRQIAINPKLPRPYLHKAMPELALGRDDRALAGLRLADKLMPDGATPAIHLHLAYGFARAGRPEDASRIIRGVERRIGDRFVDPLVWVWARLAENDKAQALTLFAEAVRRPEYRQEVFVRAFIKDNFWLDPVLDEPEFVALRKELAGSD